MPGAYKTLTAKQEAFVRAYMDCGNATEAYSKVYNSAGNMNRLTCGKNADVLLENAKVQAKMAELKAEHASKLNHRATITLEDLVAEQAQAMQLAAETRNATAFAAASMNKAKLLGMLVDKAEVRTGVLDPDEAKPDISSIWARTEQNEGDRTKH